VNEVLDDLWEYWVTVCGQGADPAPHSLRVPASGESASSVS